MSGNLSAIQHSQVTAEIVNQLAFILGSEHVSTSPSAREHHGHDESFHKCAPPAVVVWPTRVELVSEVIKVCNEHVIPVIPFGTGTGFEGGVTAVKGGVCMDLTKMDQILDVRAEDFTVTVQPGVQRSTLNNYLHDTGLWFPVDPGADASLCGMAATSASGTNAVRYGTMRENVANLQVVLADGRIIHTSGKGRSTKKTSAGYNLTNLFVGSEGTLGVITQATLRLYGRPETTASAVCSFPDVQSAVDTTVQTLQCGIPMARIEFLDEAMIDACNKYSHLSYTVTPTLFLEFQGGEKAVNENVQAVLEIAQMNGGSDFQWAKKLEERNHLWKARHDCWYASKSLIPGSSAYSTDACVPITSLPECIIAAKEDIETAGVKGPIVGHVGDGNFHIFLITDPDDPNSEKNIRWVAERVAKRALSVGGTCTGEHGVGLGKQKLLLEEIGEEGVRLQWQLKRMLDPNYIMNPGKVLPQLP
ncbi:PREDICTED: probable D-lactate dehydrogenase, mitochondrial [Priapulus caudatus]|uniref:D-lactate dehydrogenase (cytochrome) n=1 Tax=Priapulus caudatus TaxID=37621 RepID=A0ABM1F8T0_PRICU|nr:PREDICTED: probable D-lactate dehydrogenase, mitochondrial [Priapulus caudatus]